MKIRLAKAAEELGVHPLALLLYLGEQELPFEEIWPDLDSAWVDTIRARDWKKFGASRVAPHESRERPEGGPKKAALSLSQASRQILAKLWRNGRWGDLRVSLDTIRKHYCPNLRDVDAALRELATLGLLSGDSRGPYSLNPSRKGEIDRLAEQIVAVRVPR